jgi:hypothetical protein
MPEQPDRRTDNSFLLLRQELRQRLARPIRQFSFWVYILIGVVLFGGIAVWVELAKLIPGIGATAHVESIRTAIDTYFPAIGCAAAVQLAFAAENKKYLVSFGYLVTVFFAVSSVLLILLERTPATLFSWIGDLIGCFLAILMWWIANGLDRTYRDILDPEAPLGGSLETPIPGDTSGFNT